MKLRCPSGYLWTMGEDDQLRELIAAGRGYEGAAAVLGRTKNAIMQRAFKLKLSVKPKAKQVSR